MLETNGIPPKLSNGRWHLLYFENGIIYWHVQDEGPTPFKAKEGDPFRCPLIDLATKYKVKGYTIEYCEPQAMPDGARVIIAFEQAGKSLFPV